MKFLCCSKSNVDTASFLQEIYHKIFSTKQLLNRLFYFAILQTRRQKKGVILFIQDYEKLIALAENVQLYDEVKSRNEERISLEDYVKNRKANV